MSTVEAGSRGGRAKVPKGLATMDADQKAKIIRAGAKARWEKYYREHPEKLKAKRARARKNKKKAA